MLKIRYFNQNDEPLTEEMDFSSIRMSVNQDFPNFPADPFNARRFTECYIEGVTASLVSEEDIAIMINNMNGILKYRYTSSSVCWEIKCSLISCNISTPDYRDQNQLLYNLVWKGFQPINTPSLKSFPQEENNDFDWFAEGF